MKFYELGGGQKCAAQQQKMLVCTPRFPKNKRMAGVWQIRNA